MIPFQYEVKKPPRSKAVQQTGLAILMTSRNVPKFKKKTMTQISHSPVTSTIKYNSPL